MTSFFALIYYNDVIRLMKCLGNMVTDLAGTDNNNLHKIPSNMFIDKDERKEGLLSVVPFKPYHRTVKKKKGAGGCSRIKGFLYLIEDAFSAFRVL